MRVAVVTGRHVFEVVPFHQMLRQLGDFDFYVQHMEDFCADVGQCRGTYDAVLFFHMLEHTPSGSEPWPHQYIRGAIERIPQEKQGVVLLHHSLVGWTDFPLWSELVGIARRDNCKVGFADMSIEIADRSHPIVAGLDDWVMHDETYLLPEPEGHVFLKTSTPQNMRSLGWTRQVGQARVVCLQNGHGPTAWNDASWRRMLAQSLRWSAGR